MFSTLATALPGRGPTLPGSHARASRFGAAATIAGLATFCVIGGVALGFAASGRIAWPAAMHPASPDAAYQQRIEALRGEIDRLTSRSTVATQSLGDQVAALLSRQDELRRRQSELGGLADKALADGVRFSATQNLRPEAEADPDPAAASAPAIEPAYPEVLDYAPADGDSEVDAPRPSAALEPRGAVPPGGDARTIAQKLESVRSSLDAIETDQTAMLSGLEAASMTTTRRIAAALAPLRLSGLPVASQTDAIEAEGGPFIPATGLRFVERTALLGRQLADLADLHRAVAALPLRAPLPATRVSSGFGTRTDPFLNRPALHAGIDFVAPEGSLVRATAPGVVVSAGWNGGYGQMVEVRHTDGLSTRYGHLSAILVAPGSRVAAGGVLGRVGSTGRSTGPHLHYETRRDGAAADPAPFLTAGRSIL